MKGNAAIRLQLSEESFAIMWVKEMDDLGYHIDWCLDCMGPALTTEDSGRCYDCGAEWERDELE